ncbi:MAG: DUF2807 domain-containing protein [Cyclobacteriaceae bacterium]|nr:DUF2807 domain-containing protein [Cyclobacteriaceae bacterium]
MKKLLVLILWVGLASHLSAQQSVTRAIGSFVGVKAEEGIDVYLKKGSKESVRIDVTGTSPENIITEIAGSYLKIHMRDGRYRGKTEIKVYVTYVTLSKLSVSSAASIFSDEPIRSNSLEISASSAGSIEIIAEANTIEISTSSAAEVEVKGKTKGLKIDVSSAGEVDAYDLEAESVKAEASSAGSVKINVTRELTAHASSGAGIRYRGNPDRSNTSSSSGGSVKKSN